MYIQGKDQWSLLSSQSSSEGMHKWSLLIVYRTCMKYEKYEINQYTWSNLNICWHIHNILHISYYLFMAQFVLRLNSPNIATSQNNNHNYDAFFVQYFFKSLVTANHTIFKEITSIKNEKMFFLFINIDAYVHALTCKLWQMWFWGSQFFEILCVYGNHWSIMCIVHV